MTRKEHIIKIKARDAILAAATAGIILAGVVAGLGGLQAAQAQDGSQGQAAWAVPPSAEKVKNPVPCNAASLAAGKELFANNCLSCHGTAGKGNGPLAAGLLPHPADLTSSAVQRQSDGAVFYKISEGRSPMPSFKAALTDHQRWDLVNHIRALAPKSEKSS